MSRKVLDDTPRGERLHVAILGRRNVGKSSLINALTNQTIAIVSSVPGTTTDPVYKSMEILPIGPVVLIDTAGIDDTGDLGRLRIGKTLDVLDKADLLVLVMEPDGGQGIYEEEMIFQAKGKGLPIVGVVNKIDLFPDFSREGFYFSPDIPVIPVSSLMGQGIEELKEAIIKYAPKEWSSASILGDLIQAGDTVVLVTPIDQSAPKGRLILPQVQTIRDILNNNAYALVVQDRDLSSIWQNLVVKPKIVITDASAFAEVDRTLPSDVYHTAFSILFARYKGDLDALVSGASAIEQLKPGDRVLIAEACTHHRVGDDIGTVLIPRMLRKRIGGELDFHWVSGSTLPEELSGFNMIVHCGACMINRKQMLSRLALAEAAGVPMVNYGVLVAYLQGILQRAVAPFAKGS
ncbi:MAG: [FeFe] hydrogenase H-cluster maturation GTPase HydF [Peptococcaceae bacterium]|nr:[FeFe] hydrogenase H-cluster maturation GTPase HydF [Peptococcaceae bacterium]